MNANNERHQLILFYVVVAFIIAVFFITPSLQVISFLTVLNVLFLAPLVNLLVKRRIHRIVSISLVFVASGALVGLFISWITGVAISQWNTLANSLPNFSNQLLDQIREIETSFQERFHFEFDFGLSTLVSQAGKSSTSWIITHVPSLLTWIASASFLVPIFSFFILKDGEYYKSELSNLIPKKYKHGILTTLSKATKSLSKFLRAKAIEALLVSILTYLGLIIYGVQYSGVLALIAGITNILPYLGPVLGIIPAIALLGFQWPILIIYIIVNAIDLVFIFPILVGKLVNLSPLSLLVAVAVGQELYGLVGMLISVPVASAIKIIYQEVVQALYLEEQA